jgi:hypothetical protein
MTTPSLVLEVCVDSSGSPIVRLHGDSLLFMSNTLGFVEAKEEIIKAVQGHLDAFDPEDPLPFYAD